MLPLLTILFAVAVWLTLTPSSGDTRSESVASIINDLTAGDRKAHSRLHSLVRQQGSTIIPELVPYLTDIRNNVRRSVVLALGGIVSPEAVPLLAGCLDDSDKNVRERAINALSRFPKALVAGGGQPVIDSLGLLVKRWDANSGKAALLLGDLGATDKLPVLRSALAETRTVSETDMKTSRYVLVARRKVDFTKALFKLGDQDAADTVRQSLKQTTDIKKRAQAIDAVAYADKAAFVSELVPLLNDTRDAEKFGLGGTNYYLRIRDLAVNAIADVAKGKLPFEVYRGKHYTDAEAQQAAAFVAKWEADRQRK